MAKSGRNEPCGCGSGLKAKRCCGVTRGPSEQSLAVAFLMGAARDVAGFAGGFSEREFTRLLAELVDLPCVDLSLQVELPQLLSPVVGRLCEAIAEDDEIAGDAVIEQVLDELDTAVTRERLARAVIALRDRGRLPRPLAAGAAVALGRGGGRVLWGGGVRGGGGRARGG